jgi:hypothetical protein
MPRMLVRRRPPPQLERGVELSRTESDLLVQAYALVAPPLRRTLPPANARNLQGSKRPERSGRAAVGA